MKKVTILAEVVSIVAGLTSIFWLYFDPGLEPLVVCLGAFAAIVGIAVSAQNKLSKALDDSLTRRLRAVQEVKRIVDNIPRLSREELFERLSSDPQFRRGLTSRLVRLLGLRTELVPYIEPGIADLIDREFEPLFVVELGKYTFRDEKLDEFITFAERVVEIVHTTEAELTDEYRRRFSFG